MSHIKIKKGHDIKISGIPESNISTAPIASALALLPSDFKGVKPKLMVKVGDSVKIGSPLFFDKLNSNVRWASPGSGNIKDIKYGPRRVIEKIEIELDKDQQSLDFKSHSMDDISNLSKDEVLDVIMGANLFPHFRQRPFNTIPDHKIKPRDIFISGLNTAPLAVDLEIAMADEIENFQAGINAIEKLTDGNVYLTNKVDSRLSDVENVNINTIEGPHPSGNVSIQIHHISHLKPSELIWTIDPQDVVMIGKLFLKGVYDPSKIISVAGPGVKNPTHLRVKTGYPVESILRSNLLSKDVRMISGNVLTGRECTLEDYMSFYDSSISVISNEINREFIGMLNPGSSSSRYSLTPVFVSLGNILFPFTSSQNGNHRAVVPINSWERVLPMDILPNELYRSILAEDIEEMENLGLFECDDEDFALCSFACPSKTDVSGVIRKGLDMLQAEV